MAAIEEILLREYDVARTEFDQAKETPRSPEHIKVACERYIEAMRRMRKFFVAGEVPTDLDPKRDLSGPESFA